jgi:hypothetical protein
VSDCTKEDKEDHARGQDQRDRVKQLVAKLVGGTGFEVQELANGLVIRNPRDPERGQVHVAFADDYVCWERVVWDFCGTIEGFGSGSSTRRYPWDEGIGEAVVTRERVIGVLVSLA